MATQAISQATEALKDKNAATPLNTKALSAAPGTGIAPLAVTFSTPKLPDCPQGNHSCLNRDETFSIDFGDGSTASPAFGQAFSHTYVNPGIYSAKATSVTTSKTIATATITVSGSVESSVQGMNKYTDNDFGFSFWYPDTWQMPKQTSVHGITFPQPGTSDVYKGGIIRESILLKSGDLHLIVVNKVVSPERSIAIPSTWWGNRRLLDTFYFDASAHTWMVKPDASSTGSLAPVPADVSHNTMGGLHMFSPATGSGSTTIIPLSAHNFLVLESYDFTADAEFAPLSVFRGKSLAQTIVATDPSVATPVSAALQTETIKAEAQAYGVSSTNAATFSMPAGGEQWHAGGSIKISAKGSLPDSVFQFELVNSDNVVVGKIIEQLSFPLDYVWKVGRTAAQDECGTSYVFAPPGVYKIRLGYMPSGAYSAKYIATSNSFTILPARPGVSVQPYHEGSCGTGGL